MQARLWGLLVFVSLLGLCRAQATPYTYDVDYQIGSNTVTGDIVLNCDSCAVTATSLESWSFSGPGGLSGTGTSATFTGSSNLSASPSGITFTPTSGASTDFIASSGDWLFGSTTAYVSGGTGSCATDASGCVAVGTGDNVTYVASPCFVSAPTNGNLSEVFGVCSFGVLTSAASMGNVNQGFAPESLIIATGAPVAIPLPTTLPLFASGIGALGLLRWRRKRKALTA
jgi:hypothetical protein